MVMRVINQLCGTDIQKVKLSEVCFFASLFVLMCYTEINAVFSVYIRRIGTFNLFLTYGLLAASFMLERKVTIQSRVFIRLSVFVLFIGAYFLLTILMHPEYENVLFGPFNIINNIIFPMSAFWTVFFFTKDSDNQLFLVTLFLVALVRCVLLSMQAREVMTTGFWSLKETDLQGTINDVLHTYNITWAYKLYTTTVTFLVMFYRSRKKVLFVPIIFSQIMILLYGSRGAFFMFFVFWPLCAVFCVPDKYYGRRMAILLFLALLLIVFIASGMGTRLLIGLIEQTGITSRTVTMFLSGEISSDSGRSQIYAKAIEMLQDVHPFGYGIYGDRYHILTIGYIATNGYGYCHNVFLELLITFGLFGLILLIAGTRRLIQEFFSNQDFDQKCLYLICFGCILNLVLSSSYWYQYYFWAMVGMMLRGKTSMRAIPAKQQLLKPRTLGLNNEI